MTTKNSFRPGVDKYNRTVNSSDHKKIGRNRLSNIKGVKEISSANTTFSGSSPIGCWWMQHRFIYVGDIYVGGCSTDSTMEGLKSYCEDQEITPHEIVELKTRSKWYKSFKICVGVSLKDKVLNEQFWPNGVFCRKKFLYPKNKN